MCNVYVINDPTMSSTRFYQLIVYIVMHHLVMFLLLEINFNKCP